MEKWIQANGESIDVKDMDEHYLTSALNMVNVDLKLIDCLRLKKLVKESTDVLLAWRSRFLNEQRRRKSLATKGYIPSVLGKKVHGHSYSAYNLHAMHNHTICSGSSITQQEHNKPVLGIVKNRTFLSNCRYRYSIIVQGKVYTAFSCTEFSLGKMVTVRLSMSLPDHCVILTKYDVMMQHAMAAKNDFVLHTKDGTEYHYFVLKTDRHLIYRRQPKGKIFIHNKEE